MSQYVMVDDDIIFPAWNSLIAKLLVEEGIGRGVRDWYNSSKQHDSATITITLEVRRTLADFVITGQGWSWQEHAKA